MSGDRADSGADKPLRNPGGKLGEILVAEGVITQPQLSEALRLRDEQKGFLHPGYGFADNKGYATARHLQSLERLGPCQIHRRSFAPVKGWNFGR